MKVVHLMLFIALGILTLNTFGMQRLSQETTDALQNQRISELSSSTETLLMKQFEQANRINELKSTQDRIIGLGAGIGVTLTTLQGLMVILTFKKGK